MSEITTPSVWIAVCENLWSLINASLFLYLEDRKLPVPLKAGFKHHNSTEDQVIHIVQKTEDDFQTKIIIVVWTDM